jgi:CheY-like chemotaxis protein
VNSAGEGHGSTFILRLPVQPRIQGFSEKKSPNEQPAVGHPRIASSPSDDNLVHSFRSVDTNNMADRDSSALRNSPHSEMFSNRHVTTQTSRSQRKHILVVDDSKINRKIMCRFLESDHNTIEATNGLDAVNKVKEAISREEPFDAILIDYQMPVMDGPTAIREIRNLGFTRLIIGVTGNVLPHDKEIMTRAGANMVLTKPVDTYKLEAVLSE